jgi:hypothetical protein
MKYVIVELTNANGILEASVSPSPDGLVPESPFFHLMLGDVPDIANMTPTLAAKRVGAAIVDQLSCNEPVIREEAEGARGLLLDLSDPSEIIMRYDVGIDRRTIIDAIIDAGLPDRHR